jgi:hypothetical protein
MARLVEAWTSMKSLLAQDHSDEPPAPAATARRCGETKHWRHEAQERPYRQLQVSGCKPFTVTLPFWGRRDPCVIDTSVAA